MSQISFDLKKSLLDAAVAVGGVLENALCRLYTNSLALGKDTVLADLDEADFDGYAEVTISAWVAANRNNDGDGEITGNVCSFVMTGSTTPNTVYGFMIVNAAGDTLMYAEEFPEPEQFTEEDDAVAFAPQVAIES